MMARLERDHQRGLLEELSANPFLLIIYIAVNCQLESKLAAYDGTPG